jgi:hypothetical protein
MQATIYQSIQPPDAGQGRLPTQLMRNVDTCRLQVLNVPQYLQGEEFRNQFLKLDGCINATMSKSENGCALL